MCVLYELSILARALVIRERLVQSESIKEGKDPINLFLEEKIRYLDIARLIETVCDRFSSQNRSNPSLEDILEADRWARAEVLTVLESLVTR